MQVQRRKRLMNWEDNTCYESQVRSRCNGPAAQLITPGRIRPRNVTRKEMGQETKPKKSESTSMRYSQPPYKKMFFPIFIKSIQVSTSVRLLSRREMWNYTYVRRIGNGSVLCSIYSDWYLASGRAQLLIQSAVCPYPHVVLRYTHLQLSLL